MCGGQRSKETYMWWAEELKGKVLVGEVAKLHLIKPRSLEVRHL
jgi:hypothetical protein